MKAFDYGNYLIEFRTERGGELKFLKKKVNLLEDALKEAGILRDCGYSDVLIRNYKNK